MAGSPGNRLIEMKVRKVTAITTITSWISFWRTYLMPSPLPPSRFPHGTPKDVSCQASGVRVDPDRALVEGATGSRALLGAVGVDEHADVHDVRSVRQPPDLPRTPEVVALRRELLVDRLGVGLLLCRVGRASVVGEGLVDDRILDAPEVERELRRRQGVVRGPPDVLA